MKNMEFIARKTVKHEVSVKHELYVTKLRNIQVYTMSSIIQNIDTITSLTIKGKFPTCQSISYRRI